MKKFGLFVMLAVMLAAPMLACGFPLPSGTATMRVTKAVCAADEPLDSCQTRQDAYQLMNKLQSAVIPDFEVKMESGVPDSEGFMEAAGWLEYEVNEADDGLGANLYVTLDRAAIDFGDTVEELGGTEVMLFGDQGYTTTDGTSWTVETLDQNALLGLGLLFGLNGAFASDIDLYTDPEIFTVTQGEAVTYEDQDMIVQTLALDLSKLLLAPETLSALLNDGFAAGGDLMGLSPDTLGMSIEEFSAIAGMLLPFLEGTEITTTLHIGADDGYIYYIEETITFSMDMTAIDPSQGAMSAFYRISGHITQHNEPLNLTPPENATQGEGIFEGGALFD